MLKKKKKKTPTEHAKLISSQFPFPDIDSTLFHNRVWTKSIQIFHLSWIFECWLFESYYHRQVDSGVEESSLGSTKPKTQHRVQSSPGKPATAQGTASGEDASLRRDAWKGERNIILPSKYKMKPLLSWSFDQHLLLIQKTHSSSGLCPSMKVRVAPIFSSPSYPTSPGVNIVYGLLVSFDYFYWRPMLMNQ